MGRAARNYGGTRGHGYFPLPGERPNVNRHVMNDSDLFRLVKSSEKKIFKSDGLKVVQQLQTDKVQKSVSDMKLPLKFKEVPNPEVSKMEKPNKSSFHEKKKQRDISLMLNRAAAQAKKKKNIPNKVNGEASNVKEKTSKIDLQTRQPDYKHNTLIEGDKTHAGSHKQDQVPVSKHDKNDNFIASHLLTQVTFNQINLGYYLCMHVMLGN